MHYLIDGSSADTSIKWKLRSVEEAKEDSVHVRYSSTYYPNDEFGSAPTRHEVLEAFKKALSEKAVAWLTPQHRAWIFDLDKLKEEFPDLSDLDWFRGKVSLEPDCDIRESFYSRMDRRQEQHFNELSGMPKPNFSPFPERHEVPRSFDTSVIFRISPEDAKSQVLMLEAPIEIQHSLERFKLDYPTPDKTAFIIMRFGKTKAHAEIEKGVKNALNAHGIEAVRADGKDYHDELYYNLLTYMHGCGFAIAIYERIEEESFNPNISLEVGYMMALRKPVCILKDKTLKALQTDIIGKLYREFDPLDPVGTIPNELAPWLRSRSLAS